MKKREIIIVSIMGILTIAIVLFGYKYAAGKKEALLSEGEKQTESVSKWLPRKNQPLLRATHPKLMRSFWPLFPRTEATRQLLIICNMFIIIRMQSMLLFLGMSHPMRLGRNLPWPTSKPIFRLRI